MAYSSEERIVGAVIDNDPNRLCGKCQVKPASVIVANAWLDTEELCKDCTPAGATDEVGEILANALAAAALGR